MVADSKLQENNKKCDQLPHRFVLTVLRDYITAVDVHY